MEVCHPIFLGRADQLFQKLNGSFSYHSRESGTIIATKAHVNDVVELSYRTIHQFDSMAVIDTGRVIGVATIGIGPTAVCKRLTGNSDRKSKSQQKTHFILLY